MCHVSDTYIYIYILAILSYIFDGRIIFIFLAMHIMIDETICIRASSDPRWGRKRSYGGSSSDMDGRESTAWIHSELTTG